MIKKAKMLIVPAIGNLVYFTIPSVTLAQTNIVPGEIDRHIGATNILDVVRAIIKFIFVAAFVIAFIMLLIGGIRWILAGGDEKKVEGARGTITAALIGLVIVLVAFVLIRLVGQFFGINIFGNICIPTVATTELCGAATGAGS